MIIRKNNKKCAALFEGAEFTSINTSDLMMEQPFFYDNEVRGSITDLSHKIPELFKDNNNIVYNTGRNVFFIGKKLLLRIPNYGGQRLIVIPYKDKTKGKKKALINTNYLKDYKNHKVIVNKYIKYVLKLKEEDCIPSTEEEINNFLSGYDIGLEDYEESTQKEISKNFLNYLKWKQLDPNNIPLPL